MAPIEASPVREELIPNEVKANNTLLSGRTLSLDKQMVKVHIGGKSAGYMSARPRVKLEKIDEQAFEDQEDCHENYAHSDHEQHYQFLGEADEHQTTVVTRVSVDQIPATRLAGISIEPAICAAVCDVKASAAPPATISRQRKNPERRRHGSLITKAEKERKQSQEQTQQSKMNDEYQARLKLQRLQTQHNLKSLAADGTAAATGDKRPFYTPGAIKFCVNCGGGVLQTFKFCRFCGTAVEKL
jgi:hypothetical protein